MARDIKVTPVITGKDAVRFYQRLEENKNKLADPSEMQRIRESVNFFHREKPIPTV